MTLRVKRFFRAPKGLLLLVFALLLPIAAAGSGVTQVAPGVLAAIVAAMLLDAPILRYRDGEWSFPDGAMLTGLIVAMILSPFEPWPIAAATAMIGVISKYVFRVGSANVLNPAALALVIAFYLFDSGQSWWGALPELPVITIAALLATGAYITNRVNKAPAVLAFLGVYYALITVMAFSRNAAHVAELFRSPDVNAALFFAFFMVTDPPTSPPKAKDQLVFGAIAAMVSVLVFALVGAAYFLLAGLLVANLWEAQRRFRVKQARRVTAPNAN
jgi:Na+-translocating ferredoxin:NAD+ oxidoreductase RnfD subunit